jgi:hypothetical protein
MTGSFLRQATAGQARATNPFLDSGDFLTPETALVIANTDVKLIRGSTVTTKNAGGGTHAANGVYGLTYDEVDTADVGELKVAIQVAGATPVFMTYWVLEEAVYDSIFGAGADFVAGVVYALITGLPSLSRGRTTAATAQIHAYQNRGFTKDVTLVNAAGAAVTLGSGDVIRAVIGRANEIDPDTLVGAKLVVTSASATANGSTFTKNSPSAEKNRLRIDASDLTFAPGIYTLTIDFYDSNDGNEWKNIERHVFTLEPT